MLVNSVTSHKKTMMIWTSPSISRTHLPENSSPLESAAERGSWAKLSKCLCLRLKTKICPSQITFQTVTLPVACFSDYHCLLVPGPLLTYDHTTFYSCFTQVWMTTWAYGELPSWHFTEAEFWCSTASSLLQIQCCPCKSQVTLIYLSIGKQWNICLFYYYNQ